MAKPTGYELSRQWFDFSFENPELIKPIHTAIYFFACEHCNRLGGKEKFGLPSIMTMEAIGVKSHNTYMKAFNDLIEWGFIELHQKSKNQYSANIIGISKYNKALDKALDKAFIKHDTKQSESTIQSTDDIDKPITINNKPINKKKIDLDVIDLDVKCKDLLLYWISYRRDINKPIKAQVTLLLLAKKIKNKGFDVSSKVINNSIENNYQGLFWDNVKETKTKPNRNIAF